MAARSTLDDFVIGELLGSGAFGCVHKVVRKQDGRTYALKEISLTGMSRQEQEDCIKETQLLASLESEHIIRFYDSFLHKGRLYICMQHAPNGNLHDFIARQPGKLPEELVWRLLIQMLLGLNHMHRRKVLHRDFKTLNVLLDENLNARLGDLGVAKVLSASSGLARTVVGTPYYLSPEMCEDKPYGEKSDVWALGVGLYECCTRRHPFDADNAGALILKILRGRYPPVQGYSRELTDIVKACLTMDVRKRPDTHALLALRSVREKAAQLELVLPALPKAPPPVAKPVTLGLPGDAAPPAAGALPGGAAAADAARKLGRSPSSRRAGMLAAGPSFKSRQAADSEPAGSAGGAVSRSPSKRALASKAAGSPASAVAGKLAAGSSRRQTVDCDAGPAPPVQQLQGLALAGAGAAAAASAAGPSSSRPGSTTPPLTERSSNMRQALPALRSSLISAVGPLAFDALHAAITAVAEQADTGQPPAPGSSNAAPTGAPLAAALRGIVPDSQVAVVLPQLIKLMYLESQLQLGDAAQ